MLIGVVSAKGSPGATTVALTLAACAGGAGLFVEMDPSGGSVECWTGQSGEPGLVRVASGLRRALDPAAVVQGIVFAPPGVRSVLTPVSGPMTESTIAAMGERLTIALAETDTTVVIDAGRWARSQPTSRRLAGCDVVLVACAPTLAGVAAAQALVDPLRGATDASVSLLMVGDRPYTVDEIASATGMPVTGSLPWEPRSVNDLLTTGASKAWSRTSLARAAKAVLARLADHRDVPISEGVPA